MCLQLAGMLLLTYCPLSNDPPKISSPGLDIFGQRLLIPKVTSLR